MKLLARSILLLTALMLGACSQGKLALEYRFDSDEGTRYLWTIQSRTEIDSSAQQSVTTSELEIDVVETLSGSVDDGDGILTIALTPKSLRDGSSSLPVPDPVTLRYKLGPNGEILKPLTDDLEAPVASALQLGSTLIQGRIALPDGPVGIGDEWDASLVLDGDLGNIDLDGRGKLLGFELKGKRKLARIETTRSGNIVTHQQQGGVPVRLDGTSTSEALASLDLDNGVLYTSSTRYTSDFAIASQESGKLLGDMQVTLVSRLELQPA